MKYNELNEEKVFTKKESNDIIRKDYNPLKVNEKIYEKGRGLLMNNKEISKNYIELLNKICLDLGIKDKEKEIKKFLFIRIFYAALA